MKKILVWVCFSCLPLVCCTQNSSSSDLHRFSKDSLIVFYHIKDDTRTEFAQSLKRIDEFGPKLIAIEAIFEELKSPQEDSILSATFATLHNVVLGADLTSPGPTVGRTHDYFKKKHISEGLLSYLEDQDGTTVQYIPLFQNDDGQMVAFPDEIVFNYRPETNRRLLKMKVNEMVPIRCLQDINNFHIVDKDRIERELIQDKIVIAGDLGPGDNYFIAQFDDGKRKTYSLVITANIIRKILSDHAENSPLGNGR